MAPFPLGARPSPPDERDYRVALDPVAPEAYPARLLRTPMPPVLNQGTAPNCVGHGTAAMKMWEEYRDPASAKHWLDIDAPAIYAAAKQHDGQPTVDGTWPRIALQLLRQGAPIRGKGWDAAYAIAAYAAVSTDRESLIAALNQVGPLVVASLWPQGWFHPGRNGLVGMPDTEEGGHCYLLWGYDRNYAGGAFVFRNSWGAAWGNGFGSFWVPFAAWDALGWKEAWKAFDQTPDSTHRVIVP